MTHKKKDVLVTRMDGMEENGVGEVVYLLLSRKGKRATQLQGQPL